MLLDMLNSNIIEEVPSEEISRVGPVFICLIDRLLRRMLSPRKLGQFVCLCFTSLQQRGHIETAPPFTVPFEGREAR